MGNFSYGGINLCEFKFLTSEHLSICPYITIKNNVAAITQLKAPLLSNHPKFVGYKLVPLSTCE
jgi:hypothetical protein